MRIANSVTSLVGERPMVRLGRILPDSVATAWARLEALYRRGRKI